MIQKITGTLVDEAAVPLANITVEMQFSYGSSQVTGPGVPTRTDDSGAFTVEVSNNASGVDTVSLTVFDQIVHTFSFDPQVPTVSLGTVTVTSALSTRPRLLPVPDALIKELKDYVDGKKDEGLIVFTANPTNNQTKTFNGVTVTFKTSAGAFPEVAIGATLDDTLDNAVTGLSVSANASLNKATYVKVGDTGIKVTAKEKGTNAPAYTLTGGTAAFQLSANAIEGGLDSKVLTGVRLVTGAAVTDTIGPNDDKRIVYYSTDDPCDVGFSTAIGIGFYCFIIRHPSADKVVLDSGVCQGASGFFCVEAGGSVFAQSPDAAAIHISGDLCQESTLFANLPSGAPKGTLAVVTDADGPIAGDVLVGGGASHALCVKVTGGWRVVTDLANA